MKGIRSKFVKESLLDYETIANSLKENTSNAVRDLLSETVRDTYNQILKEEEDEDEYEVEEVNDTESDESNEAEDSSAEENQEEIEDGSEESSMESGDDENDEGASEDEATVEVVDEPEEEDGWAEFDKYKISDDEYDFSQANDEEIVKVYKLLKDDDQVLVNVDNNKVELKDNETGAEYLLDLGSFKEDKQDNVIGDDELNDEVDMSESRLYEIVLDEYDSHVGYTDNYQKKDVMTTPSNEEPSKNVNDWDAGVPKGKSKPWAGKGDSKPFDKKVNEEDEANVSEEVEEPMEEATNVGGFVQQNSTSKSHVPNSNGRKARNSSIAGVKTKSTSQPRYSNATNESKKMIDKVNKILKENEELKSALGTFKKTLKEAAVTNVNLGQIIKLISENSTTKDEKQEIIERFGKEAKTVEQSKQLYESISAELKKNRKMVQQIDEEKQFTANSSKMINETQIYKSNDLLESLDLMHRLCK